MTIYPARKAQLALLLFEELTVATEYPDFADVLLEKSAKVLPEQTKANKNAIELEEGNQLPYGPIYSLGLVALEIFKTYIEINLANGFILALQSLTGAPILFVRKPNSSFCLYVNYQRLNNLTIKNRYSLLLIGKSLNRLGRAKWFTQLDLMIAYYEMRIKEGDEWKTAFRTWSDNFEYQVMSFGLSNTPASFQGYINKIPAEKLDIFVIVYLDDIFIYTEDPGQAHVNAAW